MTTLFSVGLLLAFTVFFIPKQRKYVLALVAHIFVSVSSTFWAVESLLYHKAIQVDLGLSSWNGPLILSIDALSAFFILVVNFICLVGFIYAGGYLKPYQDRKRAVVLSLHFFSLVWLHGAMVLVASFQDGMGFLLAWELMSLFSFVLVIFDAEKESTLKTGINYLLQMHLGFAFIMFGFLVTAIATGSMAFTAVGEYFKTHHNFGLFFLFFAGFGIKAGFVPFHTWLPRAHPAAPSHVSGMMSGVMIKMGIYGILRITLNIHQNFLEIGLVVLFISIVSGILGVIMAIVQHDLKKLLAYHSIENIGIIGIGLGLALLGKAFGEPVLMVAGLVGCILHTLNHALFKSLLFFSAGHVYFAVKTVNMDRLGGLVKNMRFTSIAFLVGALAISGIPPFNGFISEFLIYSGVINSLSMAGFNQSIIGLISVLSLVLIGGLCLYCFTKAFGMTFLGTQRNEKPRIPERVPFFMHLPALMIIPVILWIGIFPSLFIGIIENVALLFPELFGSDATYEGLIITLSKVGWVNLFVVLIIGFVLWLKWYLQKRALLQAGPTWGCGYTAGDFRHQYTPTSYASSLREVTHPLLDSQTHYTPIAETDIFPKARKFHTETNDLMEEKGILKVVNFFMKLLPKLGQAQTGMINHYLFYPLLFLVLFGLLSYLKIL